MKQDVKREVEKSFIEKRETDDHEQALREYAEDEYVFFSVESFEEDEWIRDFLLSMSPKK